MPGNIWIPQQQAEPENRRSLWQISQQRIDYLPYMYGFFSSDANRGIQTGPAASFSVTEELSPSYAGQLEANRVAREPQRTGRRGKCRLHGPEME